MRHFPNNIEQHYLPTRALTSTLYIKCRTIAFTIDCYAWLFIIHGNKRDGRDPHRALPSAHQEWRLRNGHSSRVQVRGASIPLHSRGGTHWKKGFAEGD